MKTTEYEKFAKIFCYNGEWETAFYMSYISRCIGTQFYKPFERIKFPTGEGYKDMVDDYFHEFDAENKYNKIMDIVDRYPDVITEIDCNLFGMNNHEDKEIYIRGIIKDFAEYHETTSINQPDNGAGTLNKELILEILNSPYIIEDDTANDDIRPWEMVVSYIYDQIHPKFIEGLYELCIKHGIDINGLQDKYGIWITNRPNEFMMKLYAGSETALLTLYENATESAIPSKKTNTHSLQINEAKLKDCFNATFKGAKNGIDQFPSLIDNLNSKKYTDKEYAQIALLIYESKYLMAANKECPFSKWHENFCNIIGIICNKHYDNKQTLRKSNDSIRNIFTCLL